MVYSCISTVSLVFFVRIVHPIDFLNELVGLVSETNWFDVQVLEPFVLRVCFQCLRLDGQELWIEPCSEQLAVWRRPPGVLLVGHSLLELDYNRVGLYLSEVEELLVNVLVGVRVRTC